MNNNDNKSCASTSINCDTGILGKIDLNYWKDWIFNVEIFTFLINIIKIL